MPSIIVDDVRLPVDVERGAKGGPQYRTIVEVTDGGFEQTNQTWLYPRSTWDVGYGIQDVENLRAVSTFFHGRRGMARGFRFKDWQDYKANASQIGVGDGVVASFQLVKVYADAVNPLSRKITRPVSGTVEVFIDGVADLTAVVDVNTGTVTPTTVPLAAEVVTATFQFDVPARFNTDILAYEMEWECAVSIPDINIIEVRE